MANYLRSSATGAVKYADYRDNFVVVPGREAALHAFVNQTHGGQKHKLAHTKSSNSEDALTWSCFDVVNCLPSAHRAEALRALWKLAFPGVRPPAGLAHSAIHIGKRYGSVGAQTEVDASIEGDGVLVFIEAKLYSPMSLGGRDRADDQIVWKLKVGIEEARRTGSRFYFWILDLAPPELLRSLNPGVSLAEASRPKRSGFAGKWLTAFWFRRYKGGASVTPLRKALRDIPNVDAELISKNMGWIVWTDVFKLTLRSVINAGGVTDAGAGHNPAPCLRPS